MNISPTPDVFLSKPQTEIVCSTHKQDWRKKKVAGLHAGKVPWYTTFWLAAFDRKDKLEEWWVWCVCDIFLSPSEQFLALYKFLSIAQFTLSNLVCYKSYLL